MNAPVSVPLSVSDVAGGATRVDGFQCRQCGGITRFPHFASLATLLETKAGGREEAANVFAALLAAYGADVRLVWDFAGHAWVEYWSESGGSYVAVDAAENRVNEPLLYEQGMGADLRLVVAVSATQVADVTRRYVADYRRVMPKRADVLDERWVARYVRFQGEVFAARLGMEEKALVADRQTMDREMMERQRMLADGSQ
jgi:hypothetical protein